MSEPDYDLLAEQQAERQEYERERPYWDSLFADEPDTESEAR